MAKKLTPNQRAFQAELNRLKSIVKVAEIKGVEFIETPIPRTPARITKKQLNIVKGISAEDILAQGYERTPDNLIPFSRTKAQEIIKHNLRAFTADTDLRKGARLSMPEEPQHLSPEELHRIRSEAARKAAETRRAKGIIPFQTTPEKRAEAARKAAATRKAKGQTPFSMSPEKRAEAARKAAETRRAREEADPEYAQRMKEIRQANLKKAQEKAKWIREYQKELAAQSPAYAAELKRKRSAAAKKAAETRRQQELADPELARRRAIQRASNLLNARKKPKKPVDSDVVKPKRSKTKKPNQEDRYIPDEGEVMVYNLREKIRGLSDPDLANYLERFLDDCLDEDEDAVKQRLAGQFERIQDLINGIEHASGKNRAEIVEENAYALAFLISGGQVDSTVQQSIGEYVYQTQGIEIEV